MQIQLGYKRWENFIEIIKKAMKFCENTGIEVDNHFREVTKMVQIGLGTKRNLQDYISILGSYFYISTQLRI